MLLEMLDSQPVILSAQVGMGGNELAAAIARSRDGAVLDPLAAAADPSLVTEQLTRRVVGTLDPTGGAARSAIGQETNTALVALAHRYGSALGTALAATRREGLSEDWTLADALGQFADGELIAVRDAHRLATYQLWELRDLAAQGLRVLLVTTPWQTERLTGPKAPFFGMSQRVEMPTLSVTVWSTKLTGRIHGPALLDLLNRSWFRSQVVLDVLGDPDDDIEDVDPHWERAVGARESAARIALSLAAGLHELAPPTLLRLAFDAGPYAGGPARSDRIALALRRLRDNDLIEQPRARQWRLADPLLRAAIRRIAEDPC